MIIDYCKFPFNFFSFYNSILHSNNQSRKNKRTDNKWLVKPSKWKPCIPACTRSAVFSYPSCTRVWVGGTNRHLNSVSVCSKPSMLILINFWDIYVRISWDAVLLLKNKDFDLFSQNPHVWGIYEFLVLPHFKIELSCYW